jgi:hypothetical protein
MAVSVGACATPSDIVSRAQFAPGSPVAKAIAEARAHPGPMPSFAQFPKKPTDMRPAASWIQGEAALKNEARELAAVAVAPVEISDPDAYAKALRAESGLDQVQPPGPNNAAELDAYARELRERATPPPPPQ